MTSPIEDVSSLPGKKVSDQEESPIGEIKDVYAMDGDGQPMWVSIEAKFGMGDKRTVLVPLARLKEEDGELRVPYSKNHVGNTPQVDDSEGISAECDRALRDHYGIDRADQELRRDNVSYATLVPEDSEGTAQRVEDADKIETPDADTRTDETHERLHDPGTSDMREVDAAAIADESSERGEDEGGDDSGESEDDSEQSGDDNQQSGDSDEPQAHEQREADGQPHDRETASG